MGDGVKLFRFHRRALSVQKIKNYTGSRKGIVVRGLTRYEGEQ